MDPAGRLDVGLLCEIGLTDDFPGVRRAELLSDLLLVEASSVVLLVESP